MDKTSVYAVIMVCCVCLSAFSQILLKKSADKTYENKLREYLNPLVIIGYGIFLFCTIVSVLCYAEVPLSLGAALNSTSYIFVPVLSFLILKERISKKQMLGIAVIIAGVLVFAFGG